MHTITIELGGSAAAAQRFLAWLEAQQVRDAISLCGGGALRTDIGCQIEGPVVGFQRRPIPDALASLWGDGDGSSSAKHGPAKGPKGR